MNGPYIAAFLVGSVAPFLRANVWGAPLRYFSLAMVLRAGVAGAMLTLLAGLLATAALPDRTAGLVGIGVGLPLTLLLASRRRYVRGIVLLAWKLADPVLGESAAKVLGARLRTLHKRLPAGRYAALVLHAVGPMTATGRWGEAREHLSVVASQSVNPRLRARVLQAQATVAMHLGDLEEAQGALDALPEDLEGAVQRWVDALQALLWAVQGAAEKALESARRADQEDDAIAAAYGVVRAHALACMGEEEQAKRALATVRERAGGAALERALRPVGPATDLARAMMSG